MTIAEQFSEWLLANKYTFVHTDLEKIEDRFTKILHTCKCGTSHERSWHDIQGIFKHNPTPECCIKKATINDKNYIWYKDESINSYTEPTTGIRWVRKGNLAWVSSLGKVIGRSGSELQISKELTVKITRKIEPLVSLMAEVFGLEEYKNGKIPYFNDNTTRLQSIAFRDSYKSLLMDQRDFKGISKEELSSIPGFSKKLMIDNMGHLFLSGQQLSITLQYGFPTVKSNAKFIDDKNLARNDRYRVDILFCMAWFGTTESYQSLLESYVFTAKDGDIFHLSQDNIEFHKKGQTRNEIHHENHKKQIDTLHANIIAFIQSRHGTLVSDLTGVRNSYDKFTYTCECEEEFTRCYAYCIDLANSECNVCIKKQKQNEICLEDFTDEKTQEFFKKWPYGWAGNKGTILNNRKEYIFTNQHDNLFTMQDKSFNVKHVIAKAFERPHHDLLTWESGEQTIFTVAMIDSEAGFVPENLFIWVKDCTYVDWVPLSKSFHEQQISDPQYSITWKKATQEELFKFHTMTSLLFEGYTIYENGAISKKTNPYAFTYGTEERYRKFTLGGKRVKVHRIVCFLFNPIAGKTSLEEYEDIEVDHIDGNKHNNHYTNLRWVTASENINAAVKSGKCGYTTGVNQYEKLHDGCKGQLIASFRTIKEAVKTTGVSYDAIKRSCLGHASTRINFIFEYTDDKTLAKAQEKKHKKNQYKEQ